jgi:hypothetical protein
VERAADPRWRDGLSAVAAETGDEALAERVVRIAGDPVLLAGWLVARGRPEDALGILGDSGAPEVRGRALLALGRTEDADVAFHQVPDPLGLALRADLRLAEGAIDEVLTQTAVWTHDPSVAWVRAAALVATGKLDEAVALVVDTAEDPADRAARAARVYTLAGEPVRAQAELERALVDGASACPVAIWTALAPSRPPCEAAEMWARAAGVRVADGELAAALVRTEEACAEIQVPR